jgi:hypothetical protein
MDQYHPPHGLVMFTNMRFCEDRSKVKMIINHGHVGGGKGVSYCLMLGLLGFNFKKSLYICKVFFVVFGG